MKSDRTRMVVAWNVGVSAGTVSAGTDASTDAAADDAV
jgi:hypothetical protein